MQKKSQVRVKNILNRTHLQAWNTNSGVQTDLDVIFQRLIAKEVVFGCCANTNINSDTSLLLCLGERDYILWAGRVTTTQRLTAAVKQDEESEKRSGGDSQRQTFYNLYLKYCIADALIDMQRGASYVLSWRSCVAVNAHCYSFSLWPNSARHTLISLNHLRPINSPSLQNITQLFFYLKLYEQTETFVVCAAFSVSLVMQQIGRTWWWWIIMFMSCWMTFIIQDIPLRGHNWIAALLSCREMQFWHLLCYIWLVSESCWDLNEHIRLLVHPTH